ncbi:TolC family protein [Leptolyngbya sp. AN03gr2]|uniref:TolC family protein n=1 Tax=unclassified Leptolyngbya TaxID=2650499 RepID=UPI003D316B66
MFSRVTLLVVLLWCVPAVAQSPRTVNLTLPEIITLLLQNNLDLKNATLDRIVQRQQLREAESAFTPRIEPKLEVRMNQSLSNNGISNSSSMDQRAQVVGTMRTPLGTTMSVTASPFDSSQRFGITISQPLLRGFGSINRIPIQQARLTENRNQLALRQTLSNQITQAGTAYRTLARSQEQLRIQRLSFESQRQQAEFTKVLVDAGRRPRSALVDIEANIAVTQTQLVNAENTVKQAQSDLLQLLNLNEPLNIVVPQSAIDEFKSDSPIANSMLSQSSETLLNLAYAQRPDYLQALLDSQSSELNQRVAADNQRWSLNLEGSMNMGNSSQAAGAIVLSRVLNDPALETAFQQSRVDVLKQQNNLTQLRESIKIEVESRLRDVSAARDRITSARQARELAEQRLANANERFRLGRGTDIFEVISLQNSVVTAQNDEVNARIELLDTISRLEQALGVTLDSWETTINESKLLQVQ